MDIKLHHIVGAIMNDTKKACEISHYYSENKIEAYSQDLPGFDIPQVDIADINLKVKVALKDNRAIPSIKKLLLDFIHNELWALFEDAKNLPEELRTSLSSMDGKVVSLLYKKMDCMFLYLESKKFAIGLTPCAEAVLSLFQQHIDTGIQPMPSIADFAKRIDGISNYTLAYDSIKDLEIMVNASDVETASGKKIYIDLHWRRESTTISSKL